MKAKEVPAIVQQALDYRVVDIGQLSAQEKRQLNKAAANGLLIKTVDYNTYFVPKTLYIKNWKGI